MAQSDQVITNRSKPPRKRGPVPGPETGRYQVLLEPEIADWGKHQPGGLSELVRRLLREAYEASQSLQEP